VNEWNTVLRCVLKSGITVATVSRYSSAFRRARKTPRHVDGTQSQSFRGIRVLVIESGLHQSSTRSDIAQLRAPVPRKMSEQAENKPVRVWCDGWWVHFSRVSFNYYAEIVDINVNNYFVFGFSSVTQFWHGALWSRKLATTSQSVGTLSGRRHTHRWRNHQAQRSTGFHRTREVAR